MATLGRIAALTIAAACLDQRPAAAWLLNEPGPEAVHREEAKQASIALIKSLVQILNAWLAAETNDTSLELPSSEQLKAIAQQFQTLSQDSALANTPIFYGSGMGKYTSDEAPRLGIELPKTQADAYRTMAAATNALAEQLDAVRGVGFGPSSGADVAKRQAFAGLVGRMFRVVAIGNLVALMLQAVG